MGKDDEQPLIEKAAAPPDDAKKQRLLLISFLLMIIIGLGNKIFQKLQTIPLNNYPYFQSLLTTFVYIPLSFAYIIPMIYCGSLISKEQREIPQYKFAIMGILDGIAGIMQSFSTNYIPSGTLIILLSQSAIPISMALSKPLLKAKYKLYQYIGALIVIGGLVLVLVPKFVHPDPTPDDGVAPPPTWLIAVWCLVFVLSCIPMTLSSVYKEKALGETEIDVVYLNGYVAIYQFLFSLLLAVPSAYASGLTVQQLPQNLIDGALCFAGYNSILDGPNKDNCSMGPIFVSAYIGFNVAYNVLIIMILKYGSANLLWLAMTFMVPLGSFAFALPFMPGHVTLRVTDVLGLVVILFGLILYRFWEKIWGLVQRLRGKGADGGRVN